MNPELRRNLWLELSVHRLVATPAIVALACALILSNAHSPQPLAAVAGAASALLLAAFGSKLAADSVGDEARNRTWDAQRLTSLDPWQMTLGKLFGATAFAWYAGGLCLAVFLVAGAQWLPTLKLAGVIVAGSILLHAVALGGAVMGAQRSRETRSTSTVVWLLALLWFVGPLRGWVTDHEAVTWWGARVTRIDFILASAGVFAAWAVFGAYRSLCQALHVPTAPWALVAFLGFASAYLAGFINPASATAAARLLGTGVCVSLVATYGLLFLEQTGVVAVRQVQMRVARRQWAQAARELPGWPVALAIALLFGLGTQFTAAAKWPVATLAMALCLFALRDAALMQAFAYARQPRRVAATTAIYLALLYGLLPWLLRALGADDLAGLLLPLGNDATVVTTLAAAAQAAVAVGFAVWRWRRL